MRWTLAALLALGRFTSTGAIDMKAKRQKSGEMGLKVVGFIYAHCGSAETSRTHTFVGTNTIQGMPFSLNDK